MKKITLALLAFGMLAGATPADLDAGPPRIRLTCTLDGGGSVQPVVPAYRMGFIMDLCRSMDGRVTGVEVL